MRPIALIMIAKDISKKEQGIAADMLSAVAADMVKGEDKRGKKIVVVTVNKKDMRKLGLPKTAKVRVHAEDCAIAVNVRHGCTCKKES